MFLTILIVFFSLIGLLVLHELGHFIVAKKFGVPVEEFGIGYPPRIFGKKIGQTIYSINLLPFGAFVRIKGEEGRTEIEDEKAFYNKPIFQRVLIILGGVISFWIIAFLIFSFLAFSFGIPSIAENNSAINSSAQVQIIGISQDSPADIVDIEAGDIILDISLTQIPLKAGLDEQENQNLTVKTISSVEQVQKFIQENKGQKIVLTLKRGADIFEKELLPRVSPPEGEGAMGVALVATVLKRYPLHQAFWQGALITYRQTITIPTALFDALKRKAQGEKVEDLQFVGPIGIGQIMGQALNAGAGNFLILVAMISIWLAIFNLLPIPALDGGKLLFLAIEKVKGRPVNQKIEQNITVFFFLALIALMIFVTIKDIVRLF